MSITNRRGFAKANTLCSTVFVRSKTIRVRSGEGQTLTLSMTTCAADPRLASPQHRPSDSSKPILQGPDLSGPL